MTEKITETYVVPRTGQRPLHFTGNLVWEGGTNLNNASSHYSGSTGQAEDIKVYKTTTGKYVVWTHHVTQWQAHNSDDADVLTSLSECVSYLSDQVPGWLLHEFIEAIGPENVAEEI